MVPPASKAMPRSPAAAARAHRFRADRRQIGPALLTGLHQLDQHAAGTGRASAAAAGQHRVGALGGLDREHDPLLHHAALSDIDGA